MSYKQELLAVMRESRADLAGHYHFHFPVRDLMAERRKVETGNTTDAS